MYCRPEAGESALILFTIFLQTSLLSVFGVSICGGGNFIGVLYIPATMLHFLQAVNFCMVLQQRQFLFSFAISLKATTSAVMSFCLCLTFRNEQLGSERDDVHET